MLKQLLLDRWAVHIDSYTMNRYRLIRPFLRKGGLRSLNIGTGGGVETLPLLRRGNHVSVLEIDKGTLERTAARVQRNGYDSKVELILGHFLKVPIEGQYDEVMMCEVLEHIKDDKAALKRLAEVTRPGALLILSTPTASYGQMPGDEVVEEEDPQHPDYHVRAGYDGPELDAMLEEAGFSVQKRIYNGYAPIQMYHSIERLLMKRGFMKPLRILSSVFGRIIAPLLELIHIRPSNQITIALRK